MAAKKVSDIETPIMTENETVIIFRNIAPFFESRGAVMIHGTLDENEFVQTMMEDGFYVFVGEFRDKNRDKDVKLSVYVPHFEHDDARVAAIKTRIESNVPERVKMRAADLYANNEFYILSNNITNKHEELAKILSAQYENLRMKFIPYTTLMFNIPAMYAAAKHSIATYSQIQEFNGKLSINEHLPEIKETDPMCYWIGARRGDIIRVERDTYASGVSIVHRKVVV